MKSLLFKAIVNVVMFLSCSYTYAAITHYENTDTSSFVYGSYDFDDALNTFSNITLKANFSKLNGPSAVHLDTIQGPSQDRDAYNIRGSIITEGSRDDTYYRFTSGSILFKEFPNLIVLADFGRWEIVINGGVIDLVSGLNESEFGDLIYFSPVPGNVSSVPEPDVYGLLLISPIILLAKSRKHLK